MLRFLYNARYYDLSLRGGVRLLCKDVSGIDGVFIKAQQAYGNSFLSAMKHGECALSSDIHSDTQVS